MTRFAIGDLFTDIDVPDHLDASYSDTGALVLEDERLGCLIEASAFTVAPQDPHVRNACVDFERRRASEAGQQVIEVREDLVFWREADAQNAEVEAQWHVGFGNRTCVLTLSYAAEEPSHADRAKLRTIVDDMVRSVRATHDELPPTADALIVRDLARSQLRWLAAKRARLAGRFGDERSIESLDTVWQQLVANGSGDEVELNALINELSVAFGDELVRSRHPFEWAVVTDAYGTAIAVVAYRTSAKVMVDPFNFVAKRWETQTPVFMAEGAASILAHVDEIAPPRN